MIGRYGGEEFVIICPDTDLDSAVRRAERLRHAIVKSSIGGIATLNVTSSFGVSTTRLGDTVHTLLERADACLYRAKRLVAIERAGKQKLWIPKLRRRLLK